MSEITLLAPESSTSTSTDNFLRLPGTETMAISGSSGWLTLPTLVPGSRRSPRTGRLPLNASIAQREAADDQFRERMARARARLATEMADDQQNCVARMRLARGLSQHRLAEMSGLTQPHLAKIESGRLSIQFVTAVRLAEALGISVDDLRPLVQENGAITAKGRAV